MPKSRADQENRNRLDQEIRDLVQRVEAEPLPEDLRAAADKLQAAVRTLRQRGAQNPDDNDPGA